MENRNLDPRQFFRDGSAITISQDLRSCTHLTVSFKYIFFMKKCVFHKVMNVQHKGNLWWPLCLSKICSASTGNATSIYPLSTSVYCIYMCVGAFTDSIRKVAIMYG